MSGLRAGELGGVEESPGLGRGGQGCDLEAQRLPSIRWVLFGGLAQRRAGLES